MSQCKTYVEPCRGGSLQCNRERDRRLPRATTRATISAAASCMLSLQCRARTDLLHSNTSSYQSVYNNTVTVSSICLVKLCEHKTAVCRRAVIADILSTSCHVTHTHTHTHKHVLSLSVAHCLNCFIINSLNC